MTPAIPHDFTPPTQEDIRLFCEAANRGDADQVRVYIDQYGKGILDSRDNINARAITWAAFSGHLEVVKLLVENGADINAGGTNGKPALTWAIESGRQEVAAYLVNKGASPDVRDDYGTTPLDYARRNNNEEVISLIDQRLLAAKEYERLNGEKAKEEAARATAAQRLEALKRRQPPKLKP